MALGDSYANETELKSRVGKQTNTDESALKNALAAASRSIELFTDRQFNKVAAGSPTARVYYPTNRCLAEVDDFHTTTGLVVKTDEGDDGTFETTWASTDYQLEPLNGIVSGQTGWPFWRIVAVESRLFPTASRRAPVEVTAEWGWAAVPANVKEACLILAEEIFKTKDTPFGVAGFSEFGAVRVRENPQVARLLKDYRLTAVLVG